MALMDKSKYLDPKFSDSLEQLSTFLKGHFEMDNNSTITSNLSKFLENKSEISLIITPSKVPLSKNISNFTNQDIVSSSHQNMLHPNQESTPRKDTMFKQAAVLQLNSRNSRTNSQRNKTTTNLNLNTSSFSMRSRDSMQSNILQQQKRKQLNMSNIQAHALEISQSYIDNPLVMTKLEKLVGQKNKLSPIKGSHNNKTTGLIIKLKKRAVHNKSYQDPMRQAVDSRGNIFEKQEEEDDLASSSKRIMKNSNQPLVIDQQESLSSKEDQRTDQFTQQTFGIVMGKSQKLENSRNESMSRKYTSQPRASTIRRSGDKQNLLPDLMNRGKSNGTQRPRVQRDRQLSLISSRSASSIKSRGETQPNSTTNFVRSKILRQQHQIYGPISQFSNHRNSLTDSKFISSSSGTYQSKYVRNVISLNKRSENNNSSFQKKQSVQDDPLNGNYLMRTHESIAGSMAKTAPSKSKRKKHHKKNQQGQPLDVYNMIQHSFVSPLRGVTSAAVPTNNMRGVSSSPYVNKKRSDVSHIQSVNNLQKMQHRDFSEDELNRMVSYNQINLDEQERKYYEILESEKMQLKKKENASREIIAEISRKLKQTEKKATEESKLTLEYKKRHDQMKKKLEKAQKEKQENVNQLKSLFVLFTQQRKALELSIQKSKKLEEDNMRFEQRNKNLEEQHKMFYSRIEQLEADRDMLLQKHKRDKDILEQEVEEKRLLLKKYEIEYKEVGNQKLMMKRQLDEYESKIKKLIIEFEEESKKHIRELNEVHEQYRGYKTNAMELEQRIQQYKMDQQKALQGEREAKKEVHRLRLENDEFLERVRFLDQRYNTLIHRMGASQEDLAAIDELMRQSDLYYNQEDDEAQVYQMKNPSKGKQNQYNQNMMQQPQYYQLDQMQVQDYDQEEQKRHHGGDSRLQQRKEEPYLKQQQFMPMVVMDDEGDYGDEMEEDEEEIVQQQPVVYKNQQPINGVISGEQTIEQSENNRNKKTNIEVLDEEHSLQQYQIHNRQDQGDEEEDNQSDSEDLLKKLIENIGGNPALQNEFIKEQFKLGKIKNESDLHEYKNLLNSMAALFYTNHRLNDVTVMFYMWREAALAKQKDRVLQEQQDFEQKKKQQQQLKQKSSAKGKIQPPAGIQIDTELANQEMYQNYQNQNQQDLIDEDSPSEIEKDHKLIKNMMIHIEGDDTNPLKDEDEDMIIDRQARKFLEELKQVGPYSKQILNYSYPPLLYQRGDDEDDDDEEDNHHGQLPDLLDDDDDIQDLIKGGGGGLNNEDLYAKLKNVVKDKEAHQYIEQIDQDGNVYLVEANQYNDYGDEDDMDGQPVLQEGYMDDEEFLNMMEQEAVAGRVRGLQDVLDQQNSTIINSSQNTSLEDNFIVE